MKYLASMIFCALLGLLSAQASASTFRCGTQLVSLGDRSFQVLRKCGEPVNREVVGYTLGEFDRREMRIEEWVYGPRNGMLYFLRFEGGRLTRIDGRRDS
ncbi:MAG: DUF2845 domain-containing protein [Gammaproteobacteria bacterium]|nr:DUF2845 domain-containing protein [Gammaproteobacteria bacterium]